MNARIRTQSSAPIEPYRYDDWFRPVSIGERPDAVKEALAYADGCGISSHEFFQIATSSPAALRLWVSQELVVTGPFSQELLRLASHLPNVHTRAMLMVVINGEHGRVTRGCARRSHPWLLDQLRASMQMQQNAIWPCEETQEFLERLHADIETPLTGLAAAGVGNERLILSEYTAIKASFSNGWKSADYEPFLNANIGEDLMHSEILSDVAASLIANDEDAELYYDAAVRSVRSRITYYDHLAERARRLPVVD